ncbi:hypothetical protein HK097_008720 [Rhizophlyctis rosea]|uniref:UBX domain-containing protein 1 n=1 Tax=Rhizophlyctis rosea TaxID=64517 RepID=A0AAD5SD72_9FUNG|nr:hypothetical protein HK097_008720 [Rhizophlyctis rosea]
MGKSDKDTLIEMGFSSGKVAKALRETRNAGLQPAMDWLFAHADDPEPTEEEMLAEVARGGSSSGGGSGSASGGGDADDGEITEAQANAQSLKCDDCGRMFRDGTAAEAHAIKTQHVNFSESTQAIKPLTAEEKAAKLAELQERLKLKREEKRLAEIEDQKKAEKVRRATGREMTEIKEKHAEQEMKKALEAKKREKEEERIAKAKIQAQIAADKAERQRKLDERKRQAQGVPEPAPAPTKPFAAPSVSAANYDEARIQVRIPDGAPITQNFPSDAKLEAVYEFLAQQRPGTTFKLVQTFPRKVLDGAERSKTLKELGLVPSAALVLQ